MAQEFIFLIIMKFFFLFFVFCFFDSQPNEMERISSENDLRQVFLWRVQYSFKSKCNLKKIN